MMFIRWRRGTLLLIAATCLLAGCPKPAPPEAASNPEFITGPGQVIPLPGEDACHTQGITFTQGGLFVSCVDRLERRAWVYQYPWTPEAADVAPPLPKPKKVDVTRGAMYHPSGLDHDDRCVWVAVAHYRQFMARSEVLCLDPVSLAIVSSFPVPDHIGTVAVMGDRLALMNWDTAVIRICDQQGHELFKQANPTGVAYQDCREFSSGQALCSGPFTEAGRKQARVDLLRFEPGSGFVREAGWSFYDPAEGLGREGFYAEPKAGRWYFLPGDFPQARLYRFDDLNITP
jgi:hypothetical protein